MKTCLYCSNLTLLHAIFGPEAVLLKNDESVTGKILSVIDLLCEDQKNLILYKYGFVDSCSHTDQESVIHFGLSLEKVKQLESLALRTLRHPSCSKQLKMFVKLSK